MTSKKPSAVHVLIVDDHPHGREGMRELIADDPSFQITGEAASGEEAIRMALELAPDVILMDIHMPGMGGLKATELVKAEMPSVRIVMVTVSDDITHLFEAIKRGAQGYLLKNLSPSAWIDYLRAVALDEAPMTQDIAAAILSEFKAGSRSNTGGEGGGYVGSINPGKERRPAETAEGKGAETQVRGNVLTEREKEILERVALGESNREIAQMLNISEHTVKNHLKNILQKLHLDNRVQLTRYAYEQGYMGL
ncbi:chemotaxis protein CheY [Paenibacillus beijingensis]|uniref:Chemotaxis protein CheY n=2 Tax=Paenibacillus beijingensis TaxID=1126833 RepID=A0A0D5NRA4_9BACL|nr:chemotaxis protein CheY [Paenibacillus beijingensis]